MYCLTKLITSVELFIFDFDTNYETYIFLLIPYFLKLLFAAVTKSFFVSPLKRWTSGDWSFEWRPDFKFVTNYRLGLCVICVFQRYSEPKLFIVALAVCLGSLFRFLADIFKHDAATKVSYIVKV